MGEAPSLFSASILNSPALPRENEASKIPSSRSIRIFASWPAASILQRAPGTTGARTFLPRRGGRRHRCPLHISTRGAFYALVEFDKIQTIKLLGFDQDLMVPIRSGGIDSIVMERSYDMGASRWKLWMVKSITNRPGMSVVPPVLMTRDNMDTPEIRQQLTANCGPRNDSLASTPNPLSIHHSLDGVLIVFALLAAVGLSLRIYSLRADRQPSITMNSTRKPGRVQPFAARGRLSMALCATIPTSGRLN